MLFFEEESFKKKYIFTFNRGNIDSYICKCGNLFTHESVELFDSEGDNDLDEYSDAIKNIKTTLREGVKCPHCEENISKIENQKNLIQENTFFFSYYELLESDQELTIKNKKAKFLADQKNFINFVFEEKYLKFSKSEKRIFFKDYNSEEYEVEIQDVVEFCGKFFKADSKISTYNVMELQLYIWKLAKYVSDIGKTNVVDELLSDPKNKVVFSGNESIKKAVCIFFGIIKFPNFSTIAMTKGTKFLYDMMSECKLEDPKTLIENGITSPIKIFNHLIKSYVKKINEEVNEENKEAHEFTFKSKKKILSDENFSEVVDLEEEKDLKIKYTVNKDYKSKVVKNQGKFKVIDFSSDVSASKFVFNKIKTFAEYKQLMKYFKFFGIQQIITLLQKYDTEFLATIIDYIYFRDGIDMKELERIFTLVSDFVKVKSLEANPTLNEKNIIIDYNFIKSFDFSFYDDCIMMIEVLKFDRRKHFNKLKSYLKLVEYHDNLVKYYNAMTDPEKNSQFQEFIDRFLFLENEDDYQGPIKVRLIRTPAQLITEGANMSHSAASYVKKVVDRIYIIAQVFDQTEGLPEEELTRFTLGINYSKRDGLEFDQVKGFANQQGSDRFKMLLMEWLTAKDISFKATRDLKLRVQA